MLPRLGHQDEAMRFKVQGERFNTLVTEFRVLGFQV